MSDNAADLLGNPSLALGAEVATVLPGPMGKAVQDASLGDELAEHYPLSSTLLLDGEARQFDAVLHRSGGLLIVELEPGRGALSFDGTYRATRTAVNRINRIADLDEIFQAAAVEIRGLTGFDRVMVYRFDNEWNGEVVGEAKAEHLNSFFGLRYPSTDIPAQARELYRQNLLRLIPDISYKGSALIPQLNPLSSTPLDLSHSVLRSVSPVHVEYLENMGVTGSMSISLMAHGELWGLIACHHYSGVIRPPYEVRAAAEFLGQALSLRIVTASDKLANQAILEARTALAGIGSMLADESTSAATALVSSSGALFDLLAAGGVVAALEGVHASSGSVPSPALQHALLDLAANEDRVLLQLDSVPSVLPEFADEAGAACGVLLLRLDEDQYVLWSRPELVRTVDWGGDPHNKALAQAEGSSVRLSPRKSFERWQETVRGRSEQWTASDVEIVLSLRPILMDALYSRARRLASMAGILQQSMLPDLLPRTPGWDLSAIYLPDSDGEVGGDWYDAFAIAADRIVVVVGDVAGHGIDAAGDMSQLRNAVRAYAVEDHAPASIIGKTNQLMVRLLPNAMATLVVAILDLTEHTITVACAGHLPPLLVTAEANSFLSVHPAPPLGATTNGAEPVTMVHSLQPGEAVLLYTDGAVERRREILSESLERLRSSVPHDGSAEELHTAVVATCRDPQSSDDATVLVLKRHDH